MKKYSVSIYAFCINLSAFYIASGLTQIFIEIINGNDFNIIEAFIFGGLGGLLFNLYTFIPILIALGLVDYYIYKKKNLQLFIPLQTIVFLGLLIYMIYFSEPFCVVEEFRDQCIKISVAGILTFISIFSIAQYFKYLFFVFSYQK
ncbi:hypothetical protein [Sulfurovum sp. TSL1]|uniref:hypothetical protein n=1 Tax=Sulfurovum sp. TSL1 TaxID=2826994 RepID=UPI001CC765D8|nr:hypothetical protein [Sulfurovum sp. TSL1]GIT97180.1 hypothetical protein TSL1_00010 [Sulfurovum sp. TSL1]